MRIEEQSWGRGHQGEAQLGKAALEPKWLEPKWLCVGVWVCGCVCVGVWGMGAVSYTHLRAHETSAHL
eukprot:7205280-Alexandrium_andersonii.AAC.1